MSANKAPTDPLLRLTSARAMAELIAALQAGGATYRIPLVRAAMRGEIAVIELGRGGVPSLGDIRRMGRPALILVGDDDGFPSGPDGWPTSRASLPGHATSSCTPPRARPSTTSSRSKPPGSTTARC